MYNNNNIINNNNSLQEYLNDAFLFQEKQINFFFDNFDNKQVVELINIIHDNNNNNNIFFMGVGKNDNLAGHFADMLKSISFTCMNINVQNLVHGDLGCIKKNDIIIILSRSGNTKELIDVMPYLIDKETFTIGIFSNEKSSLQKYCKKTIILPNGREIGEEFNLVPSTSILYFILFFNQLLAGLMKKNNIKMEEYKQNHPQGNIGKKLSIKVSDIIVSGKNNCIISNEHKLLDCLIEMTDKLSKIILITSKDDYNRYCNNFDYKPKLLGIITDGNVKKYLKNNPHNPLDTSVDRIMNTSPTAYHIDTPIMVIANDIKHHNYLISGIPIVNHNKEILGLIRQKELVENNI